jgi:hypothetical protein
MTNTEMLKLAIDESGLKIGFIAEFVGISRQTLWNKVNNSTPFNQYEIEKMCTILRITSLKQKEDIFFAKL